MWNALYGAKCTALDDGLRRQLADLIEPHPKSIELPDVRSGAGPRDQAVRAISDTVFASLVAVMASVIASRRLRRFRNRGCVRRGTLDVRCQRRCRHQIDIRQIAAIDPPFGVGYQKASLTVGTAVGVGKRCEPLGSDRRCPADLPIGANQRW